MARQIVTSPSTREREWRWRELCAARAGEHDSRDSYEMIAVYATAEPDRRLHVKGAARWRYNWVAVHAKRTTSQFNPADPRAYITLYENEKLARRSRVSVGGHGDRILQVLRIERVEP